MAHGTVSVDPGSSPSVEVAVDAIAGANFQRAKLADATEGSTAAIGIDANPLKVRPRRRGTADYDSGMSAVPASSTQVTATTTYVERLILTNVSDAVRTFSMANAADAEVISALPLAPRETRVLDLGGAEIAGIKWSASAVSTVRAQIVGAQ